MKFLVLLVSMVSLAAGGLLTNILPYGSDGSAAGGGAAGGGFTAGGGLTAGGGFTAGGGSAGANAYGSRQERRCTPYFENVQTDQCEAYTERSCTTTQRESCVDVSDQNCRAVVSSNQVRKCFNVTEQRCNLKEDVQFETIQVPIVVQKCQMVNERVCDTVYDTSSNQKDTSACIDVENPFCENVENTIYDRTCRTTTDFECDTSYPDNYAAPAPVQTDSYGNVVSGGSSGNAGGSGTGNAYGVDSNYGSTTNAYGQAKVNCRRSQDTKCYKTPRVVTVQQCSRRAERVCENLRESAPFVTARQSCRNEEKKVCDLQERTQPKQVKKYVYSKQCNAVPRTVCENADMKTLVPSCVAVTRKQCTFSPVEQCQDTPKEHCFKVNNKVRKERCENVNVGGYEQGSGYSAPAQQDY